MYSLRCHHLLFANLIFNFEYSLLAIYYWLCTVHYLLFTMDYVIFIVASQYSLCTTFVTPEVAAMTQHASIMLTSREVQNFGAGPGAVAQTGTECNFWWLGSPLPVRILESHTFMMFNLLTMWLVTILIVYHIPLTLHYVLSTNQYMTAVYPVFIIRYSLCAACCRYLLKLKRRRSTLAQ